MSDLATWLREHGACHKGYDYAMQQGSLQAVWQNCHRSDWMLWIICQLHDQLTTGDHQSLRLFASRAVEETPLADGRTTWDLLTDERSRQAIRVASWHAIRAATDEELAAAKECRAKRRAEMAEALRRVGGGEQLKGGA